MKYEINLKGIERRLGKGRRLPASFSMFVDQCRQSKWGDLGWFALKYTAPKDLLGFDPGDQVLPFLRFGDGGFAAFWFRSRTPNVIQCDSEGNVSVSGASFADFLLRLSRRKTSIPDLDERESDRDPAFKRLPKRVAPLSKHRKDLKAWLEANQPEEPAADDEAEAIRQEIQRLLAKEMAVSIRESEKLLGRELAKDDDFHSTVDIIVHLTSRSYKVTTLQGTPFPRSQRLRKIFERLVQWLGHPLKSCEISVWSDGKVFVGRDVSLGHPKSRD